MRNCIKMLEFTGFIDGPCRDRTYDLLIKSQLGILALKSFISMDYRNSIVQYNHTRPIVLTTTYPIFINNIRQHFDAFMGFIISQKGLTCRVFINSLNCGTLCVIFSHGRNMPLNGGVVLGASNSLYSDPVMLDNGNLLTEFAPPGELASGAISVTGRQGLFLTCRGD